ncbi:MULTISPECIES: hypothetical protein [Rhodococcus]|jgi:hypothetical protein|uniref:Uncharacterized protein n=1 Tax=Rhodococcus aetherivorans TaxID=191292 RepID=A0A059MPZ3_9NOCA|nr:MULTISPECIES: hypothetical protein [Rhodococcus]ETT26803.1 hypothetical protein RR21198_2545 [Rhodococcus rhodochrous ATCC 21198]NCL74601.1 hypothetical protein [Rhodococcus sp. YH1]OOL30795.1 hypothetical protein GQ85_17650 [Rhodococcus rhodochrous]AKE92594.1 hypothetical protein AAT18_15080 [Rhodococcus aetherivorans]KDE13102.1 hypothetical protein N505_0112220 [Rhodococcus aetherivorans]
MSTTEMQELHRTIGHLRHCLTSLRSRYGDAAAVRRLINDVDRLDIDAQDLAASPPRETSRPAGERIPIPDTPYDEIFRGVDCDDEGLGGLHGSR